MFVFATAINMFMFIFYLFLSSSAQQVQKTQNHDSLMEIRDSCFIQSNVNEFVIFSISYKSFTICLFIHKHW